MAVTISHKEKKIKNAICFFASEHERLTRKPLTNTFLYKYLAFLDFTSIEKIGRPALGLLYRSTGKNPLPIRTYEKRDKLKNGCLIFLSRSEGRCIVKATGKPDLTCFSPFELREMKKLVQTYAHRFAKAFDASDAARRATGIQKETGGIGTNAGTGRDDVLTHDFLTKKKEAMTMSKLHVLTERYMAQMKELEARMAETQHKLEVVLEASQLIVEEGLADEHPSDRSGANRIAKRQIERSSP